MNTAPVLAVLSPVVVNEGVSVNVTLMATDAEGDPLTFSLQNAPAFVTLLGNVITIAPSFSNAGVFMVGVTVSDGQLTDTDTLSVTVQNVNRPPALMPIATVTMTAGTTQQVMLLATDPDGDAVTLSLGNAPSFAMLAGTTLTFTPGAAVVDSRLMSVTATDSANATDTETFTLTVNAPANQPPALSALVQVDSGGVAVAAGAMVATVPQVRATVDDPENSQVRLEAEVISSGATFSNVATHTGALSAEGVLTLPLSSLPPGDYKWQVRALDAAGTASPWQAFASGATAFTFVAGNISGGLQVNGTATATNNAAVSLAITASTTAPATLTEMCFSNDGVTFVDCGAPVTMRAWNLASGDGSKTVHVRVRNSLNQTLVLTDSIVLDTTPPQVSNFLVNAGAIATNLGTVTLAWVASDALSGVATQHASNDGSFFTAVSASPAVFMLTSSQGQRTVTLRVTDAAGNQAQATDTIFFDAAAPTISSAVLHGGAPWTNTGTVNLAVTAADGATSSGLFQVCVSGNVSAGCLPYAAMVPVQLTGGNGMKTVLVTVSDNAGNVSLASMASVGLDQTSPSLSGLNLNSSALYTTSVNVNAATFANDSGGSGLAQVQCQTDLGAFASPVPHAASVPHVLTGADGLKTVGCRVIDAAGNQSAVATDTITLDRGAPVGSFVINAGNPAFTNTLTATLVFTATDPTGVTHFCASSVGAAPSGASDPCFTPIATTGFTLQSGEGLKTVMVYFRDGAGNVSASAATDTITVDLTPPTLVVVGGGLGLAGGASSTNSLTPAFNHSATDSVAGLAQVCVSDVSPPPSCVAYTAAPSAALTAGDGMKTVFIRVVDAAGNSSMVFSDSITLDQTLPTVSLVSVNGGAAYTNQLSVSVTSSASDAVGVTHLQTSTTGLGGFGAAVAYASPTNVTFAAGDGTRTVHLRVLDAAGNVSAAGSDSIIVDTTPPTVTIVVNGGQPYTQSATVNVAFSPSESGSGLSQRCIREVAVGAPAPASPTPADPCFVLYTSSAMHTLAAQGNRRLYVWLLDGAGNVTSAPATGDVFYDAVAPTTPTGLSAVAGHRLVTVSFTNSTDAASGVAGYQVGVARVSGGPYLFGDTVSPGAGVTQVALPLPNGIAEFFVVRALDQAGNVSANSSQASATPRWPFQQQNRPGSGGQVRGLAYSNAASRYISVTTGGGVFTSDDGLQTFTRRDPMTDQQLNGVYVDGAGDVWVVGRQGHLARSTDDGVSFDVLANNDSASPKRDLNGFTFAGTTGVAPFLTSWWVGVGASGRIVRGSTSVLNAVPTFDVVTTSTTANLNSVARCASASGPCAGGAVLIAVGNAGTALRSTDNGASWTTITLPAGYSTNLLAVATVPNTGIVYIGAVTPAGQGALLQSNNGGVSFVELPGFGDLLEVASLSTVGTEVWAGARTLASSTAVVFRYASTTRTDATLPAPLSQNQMPMAIVARSTTEVATGGSGGDMLLSTAVPTFVKRNVGATPSFIRKLSMPPTFGSTLWGVGGSGKIIFTSNSGATWVEQAPGLTPNSFQAVEAFDTGGGVAGTLVFAVGAGGMIAKSTNGGTAWALDADTSIVSSTLYDVGCRSATSCVAVGAASSIVTWSGSNWVVTSTGGTRLFRGVAVYSASGVNRAVAVGDDGAVSTLSGTTWSPRPDLTTQDLEGVAQKSDNSGVVVAVGTGGVIFKSVDHGATFTPRSSGTTFTLNGVTHVPGTTVWYVAGAAGTMLKSTDDGETWSALITNTAAELFSVCAGAVNTRVWAAGFGSTVIYSPTSGL